jgi:hypothetical protein
MSNFLTGTIERFVDDVVLRADTAPVSTCAWPRSSVAVRSSAQS